MKKNALIIAAVFAATLGLNGNAVAQGSTIETFAITPAEEPSFFVNRFGGSRIAGLGNIPAGGVVAAAIAIPLGVGAANTLETNNTAPGTGGTTGSN